MLKLVIGNRNYSSWSLRAWLYLTESGIDFEEIRIPIFTDGGWREQVARYSPAGRVPVLIDEQMHVWDSMAIIEHVREMAYAGAVDWPQARAARARARAIALEMHSGFLAVRDELPQNIRRRVRLNPDGLSANCRRQVGRIDEIWCEARREFGNGGDWLFGEFSIADVMYAPVALRFLTYGIDLSQEARAYAASIDALPAVRGWAEAAAREPERIAFIDELMPAANSPLVLG